MGTKKRTTAGIVLSLLAASLLPTSGYAQTPEQLRQLEQLTPAQRAAIFDALDDQESESQAPITQPPVISPRAVAQPSFQSTESSDGEGIPGLTESKRAEAARPELKPFGYDLFAGEPSTFAPATDIPIPVDYIIGPGDTIEVQLFGNENAQYNLVVTRDGILNFPKIGPISVVGLEFSELRQSLQLQISEQLIGVKASITMGPLRSIRVFVLGDAYRPGSYTVSALSTMTNALFVSGGINTIGSLRNVQLKRNGRLVSTIDLYDLLLKGDTSGDARLQPGDVIFIPPLGKTVGVDGEVRRPAIYELKGESSVNEVISLAGGLLPTAYPQASQIERINEYRQRTVIDVDLATPAGMSVVVRADDTVRIYSVLEKREDIVLLSGHVHRSGSFQWHNGMRLTDLIPSVRDLRPQADLRYVMIRRETEDALQMLALSANLESALTSPGTEVNILLRPRDQVTVFDLSADRSSVIAPVIDELRQQASQNTPSQIVAIGGRVRAPGFYPLEEGMRISDLLRAGGHLDEAAYALDAELTRYEIQEGRFRETALIEVNLARVLSGDAISDFVLEPHDILNIKEIPLWRDLEQVEVVGEVRFPGTYPIRRGERLSSVIERAGGLTDLAFAQGAIFLREELRRREQEQLRELLARLEGEVSAANISPGGDESTQAARTSLLRQVRQTRPTGRLVIDLPVILAGAFDTSADVILANSDRLLIPKESQTVTVIGEVQYPTSHIFEPNVDRNDYIDKSGGTTSEADKKRIYVVRSDGSVEPASGSMFFRNRGGGDIYPGDTIVVPFDADRYNKLNLWTSVTTIIYNIGVAAAAVASF